MIKTECLYRVFIKYCGFFSKNSRKCAASPSPALGCYWSYKKLPANKSDIRIALRAFMVSYSDVGDGGVAVNCEKKTHFFLDILYINIYMYEYDVCMYVCI